MLQCELWMFTDLTFVVLKLSKYQYLYLFYCIFTPYFRATVSRCRGPFSSTQLRPLKMLLKADHVSVVLVLFLPPLLLEGSSSSLKAPVSVSLRCPLLLMGSWINCENDREPMRSFSEPHIFQQFCQHKTGVNWHNMKVVYKTMVHINVNNRMYSMMVTALIDRNQYIPIIKGPFAACHDNICQTIYCPRNN